MDTESTVKEYTKYFLSILCFSQTKVCFFTFFFSFKCSIFFSFLFRYTKNGLLAIAGFCDPSKDPLEDDKKLWMPDESKPPTDLDMQQSRFLLAQVGDQFCDLLVQERDAIKEHISDGKINLLIFIYFHWLLIVSICIDKVVAWKRVVQGVREMCDVCETTLFNYHWACGKCGFVVCLDCYKVL